MKMIKIKRSNDGYGEYSEIQTFCEKSYRRFGAVEANFKPSERANDIHVWISWFTAPNVSPYQMQKDLRAAISYTEKIIPNIKKKFPHWEICGNVKGVDYENH